MLESLLLMFLPAAPAPLPKQPAARAAVDPLPAHLLCGEWVMRWNGGDCPTIFYPNGTYSCTDSNGLWTGHWSVKNGTLKVVEECSNGQTNSWDVDLSPCKLGYRWMKGSSPVRDFSITRPRRSL